jgi:hypothetical protein
MFSFTINGNGGLIPLLTYLGTYFSFINILYLHLKLWYKVSYNTMFFLAGVKLRN